MNLLSSGRGCWNSSRRRCCCWGQSGWCIVGSCRTAWGSDSGGGRSAIRTIPSVMSNIAFASPWSLAFNASGAFASFVSNSWCLIYHSSWAFFPLSAMMTTIMLSGMAMRVSDNYNGAKGDCQNGKYFYPCLHFLRDNSLRKLQKIGKNQYFKNMGMQMQI